MAYLENGTLWTKTLPDGPPIAVAAGRNLYDLRFSPSGNWVLFHETDELVRLASVDGRRSRSWAATTGQWLPGRDELAIYLQDTNETRIFDERDEWNTPIRTFSDPAGTISHDCKRRVWESSADDGKKLLLSAFPGDSAEPRLIAQTQEGGFEVLGFVRGGQRFLYWMTDEDGADAWSYGMDIWLGGGAQAVKTGISTLPGETWNMAALSPSADTLAAVLGGDHLTDHDQHLVLTDVSADAGIEPHPVTDPTVSAIHPAWSRDGRWLTWVQEPDAEALEKQFAAKGENLTGDEISERCTNARRIWLAGRAGLARPVQLTNDDRYSDDLPLWSGDGSKILFVRSSRSDEQTLWLMDADGSNPRQVARLQSNLFEIGGLFDWLS